ncbi:MAG: NUDIX domain-containing protein [Candidatus Roizmanbacteria bacterium]
MKKGIDYIGVAVGAMIFNDKDELFLSKRSKNCKNERGCWEIPGGGVNFNEKLSDAIIREMKEEYGIDIIIIQQYPAFDHILTDEKQHWVPSTFLARLKQNQMPVIMEPEKCDEIGWFQLDKLPSPLSKITILDLNYYKNLK